MLDALYCHFHSVFKYFLFTIHAVLQLLFQASTKRKTENKDDEADIETVQPKKRAKKSNVIQSDSGTKLLA